MVAEIVSQFTYWQDRQLLDNMTALNLSRLTANLISKPDLTDAEKRLGDWVMDEIGRK